MSALGPKSALVGGIAGIALAVTAVALGGSGAGGIFNLGADNTVNKTTTLGSTGAFSGPQLQVKNTAGGAAVDLQLKPGTPPFKVNLPQRVQHLNVDKLDGMDSAPFLPGNGEVLSGSADVASGGVDVINHASRRPAFLIGYGCRTSIGDVAYFTNYEQSASADLFSDEGAGNPVYTSLASLSSPGQNYYRTSVHPNGDMIVFRATWANGQAATVWLTSVYKTNPTGVGMACHVQAQAVVSR